jgi:hypothetical protein
MLWNFAFFSVMAVIIETFKNDHFMVPLYLGFAALSIVTWATTFTTLKNGILEQRKFLFPFRIFPVSDIESVRPSKMNGKWTIGTVLDIYSRTGEKLTLNPNDPKPFLALLREQAPQASFQI